MVKQAVIHPYHGILHRKKREREGENELLMHTTWIDLKGIVLNEKSQSQKVTFCMFPFT